MWIPVPWATVGMSPKSAGGIITLSITWIIPFEAITSADVTVASFTMTDPPDTVNETSSPLSDSTDNPSVTSEDATAPLITWYSRMSVRVAFSSSVSNEERSIPAAANASSVGAKTVNGPSACRAETSPACESAATRESCTPVFCAFVGMS